MPRNCLGLLSPLHTCTCMSQCTYAPSCMHTHVHTSSHCTHTHYHMHMMHIDTLTLSHTPDTFPHIHVHTSHSYHMHTSRYARSLHANNRTHTITSTLTHMHIPSHAHLGSHVRTLMCAFALDTHMQRRKCQHTCVHACHCEWPGDRCLAPRVSRRDLGWQWGSDKEPLCAADLAHLGLWDHPGDQPVPLGSFQHLPLQLTINVPENMKWSRNYSNLSAEIIGVDTCQRGNSFYQN